MNQNNNISGNSTNSSDLLSVLLALKQNILRSMNVSDVFQIMQINDDSYKCQSITNDKLVIECIALQNLDLVLNDIVLVSFTKNDFRLNLKKIKNNQPIQNTKESNLYSTTNGIILGLIYRKETTNVTEL